MMNKVSKGKTQGQASHPHSVDVLSCARLVVQGNDTDEQSAPGRVRLITLTKLMLKLEAENIALIFDVDLR